MSSNFNDEFENEEEGGHAGETFEEMLRRLAASGNLHIRHVDGDGDEDDNDDEGESVDLGSFMASVFGGASLSSNNDEDFNEYEEDDDDSNGQQFSIGLGLGSDGSVTPLEDDGSGGLSFSFTLDEDGEDVPDIRCPNCGKNDPDILDWDNDIYRCTSCKHKFIPEIYKVLDSADDYLDRSWYNFRQHNYKRAIRDANAAINLEPNNRKAYLSRGKALVEREELEQAESDFSEAIRISPDYDVAFFERGRTRMVLEKIDDAIADFTKSIAFDPDFAETYRLRAVAYCQKERYVEAINDLSEAIKRDPNEAQTWFERGYNFYLMGEHQKAIQDYSEALRRDSGHRDSYVRRAESYEKLERFQDAITDYKSFLRTIGQGSTSEEIEGRIEVLQLKLDPKAKPVASPEDEERALLILQKGLEKYQAEDYDGCIKDLTEAITLNPTEEAIFRVRGLAYLDKGLEVEAHQDFSESIRLGNSNPMFYIQYANMCLGKEKYDEALNVLGKVLERQIEMDDDTQGYHFMVRGEAYLMKGLLSEAISDSTKAIELNPDLYSPYRNRGKAYKQLGDYNSAISDYQVFVELTEDDDEDKSKALGFIEEMAKSLDSDPSSVLTPILSSEPKKVELANAHIVRASELKEAKDFAGALTEVQLAKYLIPDKKLPYELAFAIYNDMEDWENGIANLQEVIRVKPDDVMAHVNLGALKTKIGDLDGAIADLINATKLDPNHAQSHLFLGVAYLMQAKYDQAKESFSRSIDLDPSVPVAYLHRASVKEKLKEYPAAIPDFEKYCQLGGSEEVPDLTPLREHITFLKKEFGHMSDADIQLEEHKQKLQKEVDEHNLKLEVLKRETGSEIERLRKERDSLGFLSVGKKKEIDQKIHSLENQFLDFATKAEALKKQLKDLKP